VFFGGAEVLKMQTVIVSTDEPIVEMGLKTLFGLDPDFELICVSRTHQDVLTAARLHQPDVIVYGLATEIDLGAIRDVQRVAPHSALVLWAREVSTELAHQAVNLGVRGFLSTTASPEHFKECLQISAQGELWMEKSLTMSMLNNRPIKLSKRQSELVGLLVQGLKNKEIGASLGISEGTVKAYLTTLYEKVGARDRFELALFGLKNMGDVRGMSLGSDPRSDPRSDPKVAEPLRSLVAKRGSPRGSMRRTEA
jgi:DNA-binding NarL/FixJ family response regulator